MKCLVADCPPDSSEWTARETLTRTQAERQRRPTWKWVCNERVKRAGGPKLGHKPALVGCVSASLSSALGMLFSLSVDEWRCWASGCCFLLISVAAKISKRKRKLKKRGHKEGNVPNGCHGNGHLSALGRPTWNVAADPTSPQLPNYGLPTWLTWSEAPSCVAGWTSVSRQSTPLWRPSSPLPWHLARCARTLSAIRSDSQSNWRQCRGAPSESDVQLSARWDPHWCCSCCSSAATSTPFGGQSLIHLSANSFGKSAPESFIRPEFEYWN